MWGATPRPVRPGAPALRWRRLGWGLGCGRGAHGLLLSPGTGFLDWVPKKMQRVGCVELLNTVQRRVQPRLHVFGHIHEGQHVGGGGTTRQGSSRALYKAPRPPSTS